MLFKEKILFGILALFSSVFDLTGDKAAVELSDGESVALERVAPGSRDIDFNDVGKIDLLSAPEALFVVRGGRLYFCQEFFENDGRFFIVNPNYYTKPMLSVASPDFLKLLREFEYGHFEGFALDYFSLYLKEDIGAFIDPVVHCQDSHTSGKVHHTEPGNGQSPCHGEVGNVGPCQGETTHHAWNIVCVSRPKPQGGVMERCSANLSCEGLVSGFVNGSAVRAPYLACHSYEGPANFAVGVRMVERDGQMVEEGFIQCDNVVMTLYCP